jgi:tol-pal system protein YbgF
MKLHFLASPLLVALALAGAAPSAVLAADRETQQMMADLRILQIQTQQLQNTVSQLTEAMTDALKTVNTRVTEQGDANRKSFADQKLVIDALLNDVRVVRERLDDNNVRVGTLTQEVNALRDLVTASSPGAGIVPTVPPSDTGDPLAAGTPEPGDATAPAGLAAPPANAVAAAGAAPQRMWDGAMADFWSGNYDLAIMGFESYAKTFPRSDRADDALLNIGHSQLMAGKYKEAVDAYDQMIRGYPDSDVLPDAYFKKGEALLNLKDSAGARQAWEFVMKTYPNSVAALQARQRIQGLGQ